MMTLSKALRICGAIAIVGLPFSIAPADARPACVNVPGVEQLWAKPATHIILFGEIHGTAEMPKTFGEAVCGAGADGKSVAVGLELPETLQPALDAYMASEGSSRDRAALLSEGFWQTYKDGRSSVAMLGVIERVRASRHAGAAATLFAFQPVLPLTDPAKFDIAQYERAMAELVLQGGAKADLVMVLVGNLHARISQAAGSPPYPLMATHLPRDMTLSILVAAQNSGTAWNCSDLTDCGPRPLGIGADKPALGITLFDAPRNGYDGTLGVLQTTASPPAAARDGAK